MPPVPPLATPLTWNQPRLDLIPVKSLRIQKQEIALQSKWSAQLTHVSSIFDPSPESFRTCNPHASEQLRCSLLALNKPCAFLHISVPYIKKVWHDHSYSRYLYPVESLSPVKMNRTPPLLTLLELWMLTQSSPLRIVFKSAVLMVAVQKQIQGSSSHLKSDFQYELIGLHPPFVTKYRYNTRRCFLSTFKVCTPNQCLIHFQLQWLGVGRKSWWPVGSTGVHDRTWPQRSHNTSLWFYHPSD